MPPNLNLTCHFFRHYFPNLILKTQANTLNLSSYFFFYIFLLQLPLILTTLENEYCLPNFMCKETSGLFNFQHVPHCSTEPSLLLVSGLQRQKHNVAFHNYF
jgi:hypothetical protein